MSRVRVPVRYIIISVRFPREILRHIVTAILITLRGGHAVVYTRTFESVSGGR